MVSLYWLVELVSIILWSFYYQKLDRNWFPLQLIYFIGGIITLFVAVLILPESPKYLYSKQRFEEARDSLRYIATINGKKASSKNEKDTNKYYVTNYIFDTEVIQ